MDRAVVIAGPTASGKSAAAIEVARHFGGEIVNADSRQVYRGMRIGTAAPTDADLVRVPHHLFLCRDPAEAYSLALYQHDARAAMADCWLREALPVVTGGTGQYIWGLLEAWTVPPADADPSLRTRLRARADAEGAGSLHATLAGIDPEAAVRIDPANVRRVIRAIEVFEVTGRPFSQWQQKGEPGFDFRVFALDVPIDELDARIDRRVDEMFAGGFVDEVRTLLDAGVPPDASAMASIGYREVVACLQGEVTLSEALSAIKLNTRRLARAQKKWFRPGDPRITWVRDVEALVAGVAVFLQAP